MNLTNIKSVTYSEIKRDIKSRLGTTTLDYKLEAYIEEICSEGLYKEGIRKRRSKYRTTFPLFIVAIVILLSAYVSKMDFHWVFLPESKILRTKKNNAMERSLRI